MRRLLRLGFPLLATALGAAEPEAPPTQVISAAFGATAASPLIDNAKGAAGRQSTVTGSLAFIERQPFASGPWYFGWGAQSRIFAFGGGSALPIKRLQEVSGQLTLEYFIKAEPVAFLGLKPGFYFENHLSGASFDSPIEAETGIPIAAHLAGVIGGSYGRFYHHPIPIIGLIWTLNPQVRLEAVFPEPALVITASKNLEVRLAGELLGDGFKTDPGPNSTRVEYYAYRVGAKISYQASPGLKVSAALGAEVEREFDFYQVHRRYHGRPAPYFELSLEL